MVNRKFPQTLVGDLLGCQLLGDPLQVENAKVDGGEVQDVRTATNQSYIADRGQVQEGVECVTRH